MRVLVFLIFLILVLYGLLFLFLLFLFCIGPLGPDESHCRWQGIRHRMRPICEPIMEEVDITDKFMLEVIFIKPQLAQPLFLLLQSWTEFCITIKFRTSTRHQRHDAEAMALSGNSSNSIEVATDVAAARVIRYMEAVCAKVLKDYSYNKLQTKERELHLIGLLIDKEK
ncbi:hypothetical protein VPH35_015597 [Triticum aestivum]